MMQHLQSNPCLCQHWDELWEQLHRAGWRQQQQSTPAGRQSECTYFLPLAIGMLGAEEVTPGVHTFDSEEGLEMYIARYASFMHTCIIV
jgi:hypothetical protein